jgi:hypothetical protein
MQIVKEMASSLDAIENRSDELNLHISAVLLHIRASEMVRQKRRYIVLIIFMSWALALALELGRFLSYPVLNTIKFLVACAFACTVAIYAFYSDGPIITSTVYGYLIGYFLSSPKRAVEVIRNMSFDFADLVGLGTLTKILSKVLADGGKYATERALKEKSVKFAPKPLAEHFYATRHAFERVQWLKATEDEFIELSSNERDDSTFEGRCRLYWEQHK